MDELRRKRKYIPETEIETQCDDDDDIFEQNSQTYSQDWEHTENWESTQKRKTLDTSTCTEKIMVDNAMCTDKIMVDSANSIEKNKEDGDQGPTILDIHGCKYVVCVRCNLLHWATKK